MAQAHSPSWIYPIWRKNRRWLVAGSTVQGGRYAMKKREALATYTRMTRGIKNAIKERDKAWEGKRVRSWRERGSVGSTRRGMTKNKTDVGRQYSWGETANSAPRTRAAKRWRGGECSRVRTRGRREKGGGSRWILRERRARQGPRVAPRAAPSPSIPRFHPPTLSLVKAHPHAESIC